MKTFSNVRSSCENMALVRSMYNKISTAIMDYNNPKFDFTIPLFAYVIGSYKNKIAHYGEQAKS